MLEIIKRGIPTSLKLHDAAVRGDIGAIKQLLATADHDINALSQEGDTPLHKAASTNQSNTVRLLVAQQAVLEIKNNHGQTPLHRAVENGHTSTIMALHDCGAKLNSRNSDGDMPIHIAAMRNHGNSLRLLLRLGAAPEARNARGKTALMIAKAMGSRSALKALKDYRKKYSLLAKLKKFFKR